MAKKLFEMYNRHVESCGMPPYEESGDYFGCFENEHGEQWVFIFNRGTGKAELRGGDTGWDHVFQVVDGRVRELILSKEEASWLLSCWSAATAFQGKMKG